MKKQVSPVVAVVVIIVVVAIVIVLLLKFTGPPKITPAHGPGSERGSGIHFDVSKLKGAAPAQPSEAAPGEAAAPESAAPGEAGQ